MFNPDEVRRSTRTIMGIRTVPPDARVGQVLTVLPDRTFGWATAPVNTGPRGPAGADGAPGRDGAAGSNGLDGLSAYQVARANGYGGTQTQWLASLVGAQGPKGDTGATGPKGDMGAQGPQGMPGLLAIDYRDGIAVPAITSLLGISASVDVAVTWNTPFSDTSYSIVKPQVSAASASLIGKTDAVVKSKTTTGCVVTVTSTAVLATGACTLGVLAFKKG